MDFSTRSTYSQPVVSAVIWRPVIPSKWCVSTQPSFTPAFLPYWTSNALTPDLSYSQQGTAEKEVRGTKKLSSLSIHFYRNTPCNEKKPNQTKNNQETCWIIQNVADNDSDLAEMKCSFLYVIFILSYKLPQPWTRREEFVSFTAVSHLSEKAA